MVRRVRWFERPAVWVGGLAAGVAAWALSGRGRGRGPGGSLREGATLLLSLRAQPFPEQTRYPGALVRIPPGYDPAQPLDVVVYYRGLGSCVSAVAASEPMRCHDSGPLHRPSHLVETFDAAAVNALLVLPELLVENGRTDPGQLSRDGGVRAFLDELLGAPDVAALLGPGRSVSELRSVYVCSHSGGWAATATTVQHGGVPVRGVALFDSLYGGVEVLQAFARRVGLGRVEGGRFSSVYIGGAPQTNSERMARELARELPPEALRVDTSREDLRPEDFERPPVYFRHLRTDHGRVPVLAFGPVLQGGGFDRIGGG